MSFLLDQRLSPHLFEDLVCQVELEISPIFPTLPRTYTESAFLELWRISVIAVHLSANSSAYWKQYSVGEV